MENISKHITYLEATVSQTASRKKIENIPNAEQLANMKLVAEKCFEIAREHFGPIKVSSFFRSEKLNLAVGGVATSQHCKGQAIDMQAIAPTTNAMLFNFVKENLEYDQLIWEYGDEHNPAWVHVSFSKKHNRKQVVKIK